jgi:hypothetical protein
MTLIGSGQGCEGRQGQQECASGRKFPLHPPRGDIVQVHACDWGNHRGAGVVNAVGPNDASAVHVVVVRNHGVNDTVGHSARRELASSKRSGGPVLYGLLKVADNARRDVPRLGVEVGQRPAAHAQDLVTSPAAHTSRGPRVQSMGEESAVYGRRTYPVSCAALAPSPRTRFTYESAPPAPVMSTPALLALSMMRPATVAMLLWGPSTL